VAQQLDELVTAAGKSRMGLKLRLQQSLKDSRFATTTDRVRLRKVEEGSDAD